MGKDQVPVIFQSGQLTFHLAFVRYLRPDVLPGHTLQDWCTYMERAGFPLSRIHRGI